MKNIILILVLALGNTAYGQISKVNKVIDSCVTNSNFNGVVLIAKSGKIDYLKYTGIANRHYDIKFSEASRFHIFSVTKTFTAVLIMQLYEQKRINLDATISTYYPEYKGEAGKKATIRNLLTYSSGRDTKEMKDVLDVYSNDIWTVDTFITKYCSEKLIDTPGTKFNYNNGDYIILGKIIENICRKPYEDVLREKILIPLKMQHTDYLHHNDIIKGMAEGYATEDSSNTKLTMPTNYYIDNLYSAGAMYSTPEDLLIFDQALFNHTILKKETVDLMLTSYKNLGDAAFGLWVYPRKFGNVNTVFAERQGGGYGHHSNWVHLVDKDLTFILLSNTNTVDLNKMRLQVIAAYLGQY
ncbi:CubicO group peptidase (beta-lactamase class C family) [Chitinophaga niastensis]|uniref:CubicO group peptidase (Beta-lactamase class C family) n=1 Tax=Chitinophaga niastensis TaxID=536980 RepID=A0A2P8HP72_CHINA|nr:serine hydrolase domain-containing protein [Chitinophaga niastensis]PSL48019.1 CubicO group peptidase (beta-lactamase class C family) [Chitinophaga niastensis]